MRNPSTLMIWWSGSTRAPYLRTVSPSTSTRPSAISSSQCLRLPRPAAASTFCSRTPPGTSVSESRSPSSGSSPAYPPAAACVPRRRGTPRERRAPSRALVIAGIPGLLHLGSGLLDLVRDLPGLIWGLPRLIGVRGVVWGLPHLVRGAPGVIRGLPDVVHDLTGLARGLVDLVGEERGELGQLLEAGQAEPFQEVPGGPVEDRPGLAFGSRVLDQPAQRQRAHHRVTVDAADRRDPRPADRLAVGDDGKGLQRRLGEAHLLPVAHEPLHDGGAFLTGVEPPAARHLPQV